MLEQEDDLTTILKRALGEKFLRQIGVADSQSVGL